MAERVDRMSRAVRVAVIVAVAATALSATPELASSASSPQHASSPSADARSHHHGLVTATVRHPNVRPGDDWSLPRWARPAENSGFFSESASPRNHVDVRSIDLTWRQIQPRPNAPLDLDSTGTAEGMPFASLSEQLAQPGPYWLRLFSTGKPWAPGWVMRRCDVGTVGPDYDGMRHLPIWNACVWNQLRATWRRLLVGQGILDDPQFRFAYVPGGFTWSEFDFDVISEAYRHGRVTKHGFLNWFGEMTRFFARIGGA
ncbi:MAG TPA: hypothetical protein VLK34_09460, partial [Nocardioidaceae bacterium]|nr:hypothetical protein [Nocardioidaceae bacterium]